nr:hypothetical protein [Tanacetum cinerariifolium]
MVNPTIHVSCIKKFWATASVKRVNNVVKLQALIDRKKVIVTEDIIRQALRLDDANGVECFPTEEIFAELVRTGYAKSPPKLTFYKAFLSAQWKFLIHTLVQCRKFNFSKYIFDSMIRNVDSPSKSLCIHDFFKDDLSSHKTKYTSPALTQKVFANMRRIRKGFSGVETPLFDTMLVQPQADAENEDDNERVESSNDTVVDAQEDASKQGENSIIRYTNKMKAEKARILDEKLAKRLQDEEIEQAAARKKQEKEDFERAKVLQQQYDQKKEIIDWNVRPIFEREYNKVQTLFIPDKDVEEPSKKRVAKETLLQESFKKLRAEVEVSEKDYPLSDGVMILMLSTKLQVKEDSEMARDLVMKIFMKANQPKSRSLDTSSK